MQFQSSSTPPPCTNRYPNSPLSAGSACSPRAAPPPHPALTAIQTHHFLLTAHAVPERLHPLPTQNTKDHHEGVEEVSEVPPERWKNLNPRNNKRVQKEVNPPNVLLSWEKFPKSWDFKL